MENSKQWIESQGLRILILKDNDLASLAKLESADVLVLVYSNEALTEYIIKSIRVDENERSYLMPIFVLNKTGHSIHLPYGLVDLEVTNLENSIELITERSIEIRSHFTKMEEVNPLNFESLVINKMLRYFYSRDIKNFTPEVCGNSSIGYCYPMVSLHEDQMEEKSVLDILKTAEDEGYITGDHLESIYLCNHCANGFLHYREVCPKCNSSNLHQEDLIHHFPCAHIGPFSDFSDGINSNELNCPKCNKQLKHIGVDYDKPSVIYSCRSCDHKFQDALIHAKCVRCHKDIEVEHLMQRVVKKYHVSTKGFYNALHGVYSTDDKLATIAGTVNMNTFKVMLQYEIERMKIAEIESNLAYIHINNANELYLKIGKDSKLQLLSELVQIIRNSIRTSDIIAFESTSTMLFSLNESKLEDATRTAKRIGILIRKLIRDNFNGFQADIIYRVHGINKTTPHQEQLSSVLENSK